MPEGDRGLHARIAAMSQEIGDLRDTLNRNSALFVRMADADTDLAKAITAQAACLQLLAAQTQRVEVALVAITAELVRQRQRRWLPGWTWKKTK